MHKLNLKHSAVLESFLDDFFILVTPQYKILPELFKEVYVCIINCYEPSDMSFTNQQNTIQYAFNVSAEEIAVEANKEFILNVHSGK